MSKTAFSKNQPVMFRLSDGTTWHLGTYVALVPGSQAKKVPVVRVRSQSGTLIKVPLDDVRAPEDADPEGHDGGLCAGCHREAAEVALAEQADYDPADAEFLALAVTSIAHTMAARDQDDAEADLPDDAYHYHADDGTSWQDQAIRAMIIVARDLHEAGTSGPDGTQPDHLQARVSAQAHAKLIGYTAACWAMDMPAEVIYEIITRPPGATDYDPEGN